MKKILALLTVIGFVVATISGAAALTTEQRDDRNTDGSSKFSDPDEQMPNFVAGSGDQSNSQNMNFNSQPVTPPGYGDRDEGAAAFNHAYMHLQDNH
jgi:hypothetical protein